MLRPPSKELANVWLLASGSSQGLAQLSHSGLQVRVPGMTKSSFPTASQKKTLQWALALHTRGVTTGMFFSGKKTDVFLRRDSNSMRCPLQDGTHAYPQRDRFVNIWLLPLASSHTSAVCGIGGS
eukprot:357707-Chlamydomonas_euryale.AAC.1